MNRFALCVSAAIARVTESALGPCQAAVIRIGFSATWLLFLLREFPHRLEMYGPDGPWSWDLAEQLISMNGAFTALMWFDGRYWFEAVYALAVLASVLLLLGWRTRTMSVLFMVGVLSLQNRSVFMGDGGDNVLHLMCIYLVFTRCGQVWSLDARRARLTRAAHARGEHVTDRVGPLLWGVLGCVLVAMTLTGRLDGDPTVPALLWTVWLALGLWWVVGRFARSGEPRILLDVVGDIVHNGALLVIMAEACLIYATAGWYKIQGSRWQDGTAVYYPLQLDSFSPWPALADLLSASGTMVMLVTYGTVAVQVAFPFTLFNRRVKNVLLAAMIIEHAAIAVILGLPFFSLAMIAADSVFLPTSFLRRLAGWAARARGRLTAAGSGRRAIPELRASRQRASAESAVGRWGPDNLEDRVAPVGREAPDDPVDRGAPVDREGSDDLVDRGAPVDREDPDDPVGGKAPADRENSDVPVDREDLDDPLDPKAPVDREDPDRRDEPDEPDDPENPEHTHVGFTA